MHTPIGGRLRDSAPLLYAASTVAAAAVLADFTFVRWGQPHSWYSDSGVGRGAVTLPALWTHLMLVGGDSASVGLIARPIQGWAYWVKTTAVILLLIALMILISFGIWVKLGRDLPIYTTPPWLVGPVLLSSCFIYPVLEEGLYRMVICVPASVLLRPWGGHRSKRIGVCRAAFRLRQSQPRKPSGRFLSGVGVLKKRHDPGTSAVA